MPIQYITNTIKQFDYYKSLGEKTMTQLSDEQLFWKFNVASNSIAMIVKHLAGNMLSRWTDFRMTDGEKVWRNRETEFADDIHTREALMDYWNKGWTCLLKALDSVSDEELDEIIYIRNQGHTTLEAINRQLAHYPYHIGQMAYIGRMLLDDQWQSLSIPKGQSDSYNQSRFSKSEEVKHYTDDVDEE